MTTADERHNEKFERSIWEAAYLRAISLYDPEHALKIAQEAIEGYRKRWPDGDDDLDSFNPDIYRNFANRANVHGCF